MTAPRDEFTELLRAVLNDQVIDGTAVTASTVGALMAAHADEIAALIADDAGEADA